MPKRKTKPLTLKEEQKKRKKVEAEKNEARKNRREDPEYLQAESARDLSTLQNRRADPEYLRNESARDLSSLQGRRSDPEYLRNQSARDLSSLQSRRADPEYLRNQSARDLSSLQSRRADSEYLQAESLRDSMSRRSRRSDPEYLQAESNRDISAQRRRRMNRIPWTKAIDTFNDNVKDGPYHRCYSCDRLFFKTQITITTREKLQAKSGCTDDYLTGLILPELIDDAEYTFCSTCMAHIRKLSYSKFNINQNNLKFPEIPECLKKLTPLGERCVAARIPFMKIERANYAGQLKIKSGIVNVPMDVSTAVNAIPRPIEDTHVIEISFMRKMAYKNPYLRERVIPADIWAAAEYLCQQKLYIEHGITLNQNLNPAVITAEREDMDLQSLEDAMNSESMREPDTTQYTDRHLPEETLLDSIDAMRYVPELDPSDAVRIAPGEGQNPIPMFMDKNCEELSFPKQWCGQPRALPPAGVKPLSNLDYVNSEIRRYDRRACRPDHILYLHKKCQIEQLSKHATIVLRKSSTKNRITAGQVVNHDFLDNAVNNDSAYRFMAAITGSPAYFEAQKKKVMAMVRQFGGFTFFITNSAAETHWPELLVILSKTVDKIDITGEVAMELSFEEKSRLISADPVTCAQYFYHRLKQLWKTWEAEDGPFGNYQISHKYCRIEWQHRGSPHAHQFVDLKDAPKFDPEDPESYKRVCDFIDSMITTDTDDPEVSDIIYVQKHNCKDTCRKGHKGPCRFNAPFLPLPQTMILEPIPETMVVTQAQKDEFKRLNDELNNILESEEAATYSFDDLLDELGCTFRQYLLAARSKLKTRKVFVKRLPKNARINPYNKKILIAMRSNMDIQYILDVYSCISYVVDYVNKADKGLSRMLRKCLKEYENGNHTIKTKLNALAKVLYNCSETSAQEAAWIRLRQPMCMSTDLVEFIHSGPKSDRTRMLKTNAELKKLSETNPESEDIYKKGPIDRYSDRPDELEGICLADFIANFTFKTKGKVASENEDGIEDDCEELEIADDEGDDLGQKKVYTLKNNSGTITRRKRPKVIRYCRFDISKDERNYYREMCLLFMPWRDEDAEIESQNCHEKFEQHKELIKANFDKYNAVSLDLEQMAIDIQNDRLIEEADEPTNVEEVDENFQNVYDFDDTIVQPNAALEMRIEQAAENTPAVVSDATVSRYKVPDLMPDDEYLELCNSLNQLQRDYLMHVISCFKNPSSLPIYHFISGGAGVGKSRLIKAIFQSVMRIYRSEPGPIDSNEVLLVAYTGMAAHNIGGITAHSAFHLAANQGKTDKGLSPDIANTLASNLRSNKLTIIDEISFLSAKHFDQISSNLKQAFRSDKEFAGRSIIAVGDFQQLKPIGGPYCFEPKNKHTLAALVDNPQWKPFQIFELTEIMRQKDDLRFAQALSRLAFGRTTEQDNQLFESRCFNETTLPIEARTCLRLMAYNDDVDAYNMRRAHELIAAGARQFTYKAIDKFIGNYTEDQKRKARHVIQTLKPKDTQGLMQEINLVIGLRYMISTNIDVCDGLFNGACGVLRFVEIRNRQINAIYIEFDDVKTGAKARSARHNIMTSNTQIQLTWTPITVTNRAFHTTERGKVQVCREQFPVVMAEAITIHKSQGRSEQRVCVDIRRGMDRQKTYVAFSRATSLNGLFMVGKFNPPKEIAQNDPVNTEMARLRQNPLVPKFQFLRSVPDNVLQIVSHNVQSIRKHIATVASDAVFTSSHFLAFQESWAANNEHYNIWDYEEISRNKLLGRPRAFGTINFCKSSMEARVIDRIEVEQGDSNSHIELTGYRVQNRLVVINIYNSPKNGLERLINLLSELEDYIGTTGNALLMGDFNHTLNSDNRLEKFLKDRFDMDLISPREPTTSGGTCIDGVFGRLSSFRAECFTYESYASYHKPIVVRLSENE